MITDTSGDLKKKVNGSLITGVLVIVLGIVAIALPVFSTIFAETWFALILASTGVTKLIYAFQTRKQGETFNQGFIWQLLLGILYIGIGVVLFANPFRGAITLTLLLASFLLTEGVFESILAFRLRPQQNWTWVLVDGIITLGLGAMIWFQWPFDAPWLIGTLVGASILFTGISRVMLSLNVRSALNLPDSTTQA